MEKEQKEAPGGSQREEPGEACRTVQFIKRKSRCKKRQTQANRLRGRRGWGSDAVVLRGGETRRIGSKSAADKFGEHFSCSGVIPGGLEIQGLGKGPPGVLAGGAAEKSVLGCLDFLLTPWAKPRVWAVPIRMAQGVGGSQLHPKEARGCVAREGEDGRELCGGGEREVVSWFVPDLPLLEKPATDLRAQVGVGPWEISAVGRVILRVDSEFYNGISEPIAHDACMTGCPPYLDC